MIDMKDINVNSLFKKANRSKSRLYKKIVYFFMKHYFYCDIHPETKIGDVNFCHSALGIVINEEATIGNNVTIQHHVCIGKKNNEGAAPVIDDDVYIGCGAVILGDIRIGKGAQIGAMSVVTKDVRPGTTVVGNPARELE